MWYEYKLHYSTVQYTTVHLLSCEIGIRSNSFAEGVFSKFNEKILIKNLPRKDALADRWFKDWQGELEQSQNCSQLRVQILRGTPLCHGPKNPVLNPVYRSLSRDQPCTSRFPYLFWQKLVSWFNSEITSFWIWTQMPPSRLSNANTETYSPD